MLQVSLGFKEIQTGTNVLKFYKRLIFSRKQVYINISRPGSPALALVPASRYNCDVKKSHVNDSAKFQ